MQHLGCLLDAEPIEESKFNHLCFAHIDLGQRIPGVIDRNLRSDARFADLRRGTGLPAF